jgi:hypothetical protein
MRSRISAGPVHLSPDLNGTGLTSRWQLVEKFAQLDGRFELWNRVELLERAGKHIRQAPHRVGQELWILRL